MHPPAEAPGAPILAYFAPQVFGRASTGHRGRFRKLQVATLPIQGDIHNFLPIESWRLDSLEAMKLPHPPDEFLEIPYIPARCGERGPPGLRAASSALRAMEAKAETRKVAAAGAAA
jgi:hypothetical protein